eukprot:10936572-Alexandrium_andersonii.AAC.1
MGFPGSRPGTTTLPPEGRAKGPVGLLLLSLAELGMWMGTDLVVHESTDAGMSLLTHPIQALR